MAGSPPLQPGSETQLDGWGHVGAPEGLQLPLSLEQGGGSCHQGKLSWDVGGGEEQRAEKEAESGGESPRGRGLGETTQLRFSPSTQEQKDAKTGASWAHWPADPPFLFAGGWAVTQGGSQWERRRWLYQLMLKKTRGSCLHSHPSGPLHLQQRPRSHPHSHSEMPRAFGGTDAPSFTTWHRAHRPHLGAGCNPVYDWPGPSPTCNHPLEAGLPALSPGDSRLSGMSSPLQVWGFRERERARPENGRGERAHKRDLYR